MISKTPSSGGFDSSINQLDLGWWQSGQTPFGFAAHNSSRNPDQELLTYDGDGHLLTIAPTGWGKGRDVIIPTLLTSKRSMIVLDVKGELYSVTARQRRAMGQHVIGIDPFNIVLKKSDGLNPFELLKLPGADVESDACMLAGMLSAGNTSSRDRFWDLHGTGFLSGLIAHFGGFAPDDKRSLLSVRDILLSDDPIYGVAALADEIKALKEKSKMAYRELCGFLNQAERDTRPSVLATTTSYLKPFGSEQITDAISESSFDLQDVVDGEPLTVYLIFPVEKLVSHAGLMRMLFGTLMATVMRRRFKPLSRTLFILDECAQLGHFDLLKPAVTLLRGFGMQCWLFFQSLHQLKGEYPNDWRTLLDNMAVVQTFGFNNRLMAEDWGNFFGEDTDTLMDIESDEQWVHMPGSNVIRSKRFNYLRDKRFHGHFDANPLCELRPQDNARMQ
jgi:type IV secretion system protein VirD4